MVQTVEKVVSRHVRVVLSYTPVETGPSLLYVQLFGIDLPGSPFELLVERTLPPPPPPRADDAEPESADGRTQAGARAAAQPVHRSSRQQDRRQPARAPSPQEPPSNAGDEDGVVPARSPSAVQPSHTTPPCAAASYIVGLAPHQVRAKHRLVAGVMHHFRVQLCDSAGSVLDGPDGQAASAALRMTVMGIGELTTTVHAHTSHVRNGLFELAYCMDMPGIYEATVTVASEHVRGSPFAVVVDKPAGESGASAPRRPLPLPVREGVGADSGSSQSRPPAQRGVAPPARAGGAAAGSKLGRNGEVRRCLPFLLALAWAVVVSRLAQHCV
jgi:hypothetical protein